MQIHVTFFENRRISLANPDPAKAFVGDSIVWAFDTNVGLPRDLIWMIYFSGSTPFKSKGTTFRTVSAGKAQKQRGGSVIYVHSALSLPLTAEDPGDFKYGIRVIDSRSNQVLGDDDPYLLIR